jgi:hypothetical protein
MHAAGISCCQRLGDITAGLDPGGPHQLTYRQVEHTSRLIRKTLAKAEPDGAPPADLQRLCDQLLEASIPAEHKQASSSLAVDWTDVEAWARAVPASSPGTGADPEARWGHRNVNRKIELGEMFSGYYMPAATMVNDEDGLMVPELVRRITVCSSAHDPAAALVPVLAGMAASGARPGDILAGSGFSYRAPSTWANPLRGLGAQLAVDLHPQDRGPQGTHEGAVTCNGNLHCPQTPKPLLQLIPLPPGASAAEVAAHDQQTTELSRYKPGLHATEDADGHRRLACPAATGKIRCPLRPASMKLERSRPETSPHPSTRRPAAPRRPSPPGPASPPRPGRSTTTPQRPGGAPTGGAPPASGSTPASRTPPPGRSTAAGSGSPASRRSRCGSPACWPSATSGSWPPGRPATTTTPAAPPKDCRHGPASPAANSLPPAPRPHSQSRNPEPQQPPLSHQQSSPAQPRPQITPQPQRNARTATQAR